jgi:hypothetical protein
MMVRLWFIAWFLATALGAPGRVVGEPFRYPEAKHGAGELRSINRIPVLMVAGTPEEMGEQMGVLALKPATDFPFKEIDLAKFLAP